jgi:hypothetical protein
MLYLFKKTFMDNSLLSHKPTPKTFTVEPCLTVENLRAKRDVKSVYSKVIYVEKYM